jgi:hypothetical protein
MTTDAKRIRIERYVAFAAISLSILLSSVFFLNEIPKALDGRSPEDFPNYYFASKRILENRPVYDFLAEEVAETLGWESRVYPADTPFTLALLSPLSLLEYKQAWWLFFISSILLGLTCCWLVARELRYSTSAQVALPFVFLSSAPFLFLLKRNHMEMWVLLFAVLGWKALRNSQTGLGSIYWALASALKLFPLFWLASLVHKLGIKRLMPAVAAIIFFGMIGLLAVGAENSVAFVFEVIPRSQLWYGVVANYSIVSVATALGAAPIGWILSIALGCLIFWPRLWRGSYDQLFINAVCISLLISPLSWMNYQILLMPCLLILAKQLPLEQKSIRYLFFPTAILLWGWPSLVMTGNQTLTVLISSLPTILTGLLLCLNQLRRKPSHVVQRQGVLPVN